mgnify:CR=1 FL=1
MVEKQIESTTVGQTQPQEEPIVQPEIPRNSIEIRYHANIEVGGIMEKELGIPANRTYVSYWGTDKWGWNGGNF